MFYIYIYCVLLIADSWACFYFRGCCYCVCVCFCLWFVVFVVVPVFWCLLFVYFFSPKTSLLISHPFQVGGLPCIRDSIKWYQMIIYYYSYNSQLSCHESSEIYYLIPHHSTMYYVCTPSWHDNYCEQGDISNMLLSRNFFGCRPLATPWIIIQPPWQKRPFTIQLFWRRGPRLTGWSSAEAQMIHHLLWTTGQEHQEPTSTARRIGFRLRWRWNPKTHENPQND